MAIQRRGTSAKRSLSEEVAAQQRKLARVRPSIDSFIHSFVRSLVHSSIHPFIHSSIHRFTDSLVHWLVDSLSHCFVASLVQPFTDSLIQLFIDSLAHWFIHSLSGARILSCHFIGISATICSFADAPHNFNRSWLLHLKNIPVCH